MSNYAASWLKQKFNVESEVFYNGVDTDIFHSDLPDQFRKGTPQLLFVGNLYEHKMVNELVLAAHALKKQFSRIHMSIIGDGPCYSELETAINKHNLKNTVSLEGRVSDKMLPLYYASCDVYVTASTWEMFGLPLIESMACGKPFVASSIPAHIELAKESAAGEIYPCGNVSELISRICSVYSNKEKYAKNAIEFAKRNDWRNKAIRLEKIYSDVIK